MSTIDSLDDLLEEQLKDIYSAEKQITKALPRLAKAAGSEELREALLNHLEETEQQIARLEEIAELLEIKLSGKKCKGMEGLIEEGKEVFEMDGEDALIDAAIVAACQKVEHYEISAYGTARTIAEKLGQSEVAKLLDETLDEESAADEKLTAISEGELLSNVGIGVEAQSEDEEELESEKPAGRGKRGEARV